MRNRYVFIADVLITALAVCAAYGMRFGFNFIQYRREFVSFLIAAVVLKLIAFYAFGLYRRYWRYAGYWDLVAIVLANSAGSAALMMVMYAILMMGLIEGLPRSVLALDWILAVTMTVGCRASVRAVAETIERAAHGDFRRGIGPDPESAATLQSLETWLHIKSPEQLDASTAREALNCATCHDSKDPHFKRFGSDCAQCHVMESWIVAGYQHPSPSSTDCVQCHLPPPSHFMGHFSMVSQKFSGKENARVGECFECHKTTSWNDIVGLGFYKHH